MGTIDVLLRVCMQYARQLLKTMLCTMWLTGVQKHVLSLMADGCLSTIHQYCR